MQNKVCDINLLHFLSKWDISTIPNKRVFNLKKMVNDTVAEGEAGDKGKRGVFLVWIFIQLFLVLASSKKLGVEHHGSCCPTPLATRQQEVNPSLPSFCPLNYQSVNSVYVLRRLHLLKLHENHRYKRPSQTPTT